MRKACKILNVYVLACSTFTQIYLIVFHLLLWYILHLFRPSVYLSAFKCLFFSLYCYFLLLFLCLVHEFFNLPIILYLLRPYVYNVFYVIVLSVVYCLIIWILRNYLNIFHLWLTDKHYCELLLVNFSPQIQTKS